MIEKDQEFESCMRAIDTFKASDFIMVIFGGAGDLSQKKLIPTLYLLFKKNLISNFSISGVGTIYNVVIYILLHKFGRLCSQHPLYPSRTHSMHLGGRFSLHQHYACKQGFLIKRQG